MQYNLSDAQEIKLLNADDVYKVMQDILVREDSIDQDREHFWMIGMSMDTP